MRQRVAIARTLAVDPDLFLLDEPFAALDAQTKMAIQNEFIAVWEARKTTVVLVTHDIAEAVLMADRVIVFTHRPARIKRDLKIDISRPRDPDRLRFSAQFASLTELLWSDLKKEMEVTA
jgi:NitT/TauT family transport system ATP-binding protein